MQQIVMITEKINQGQIPVITGDQKVYEIGKRVQWLYPSEFKDVVWMLGPLHIEKNFMEAIGDWMEGSGWCKIYNYSGISTSGRVESFLTCSGVAGIKRARYAHQVTLGSLTILAKQSFDVSGEVNFRKWRTSLCKNSPTAKFWFSVMDMELILFMFIRSLRESNFELFLKSD